MPYTNKQQILRRPAVERKTGLSRSSIYAKITEGVFPKPIRLGKRAVGWLEHDIEKWLDDCKRDEVEP